MHTQNLQEDRTTIQKIGLYSGPLLFLFILFFVDLAPGDPLPTRMAAVATLMAIWWMTDALPLYVTSLLPMVMYPLLGILNSKVTAPIYFNSIIFLFIGGFMIALTMERWHLHKRIALFIIKTIGGGPSRIILGFMSAAAFLSMWISNTATAMMMLPIGLAIVSEIESRFSEAKTHHFTVGLMLGIAYSCSLGGIATLVGTPPNLSLVRIFSITFPDAPSISFANWFILGLPLSVIMLVIVWFLLTQVFYRVPRELNIDQSIVAQEYRELGPIRYEEKVVLTVLSLTALMWVFRKKIQLGFISIPGWSQFIPYPDLADDATVAMFMALLLFLIPARSKNTNASTIIEFNIVKKLPWNIVLLFGGGFALAKGFQSTGLASLVGEQFSALAGLSAFKIISSVCLILTFLTELTSNTATTEMVLPILASVAQAMKINPLFLMIPATISTSFAFMMPVATPPNAIAFGSGRIKVSEMVRVGIWLNLIGILVITILFLVLGEVVFNIDPTVFPEWAQQAGSGNH